METIILQGTTTKELSELISEGIRNEFQTFEKKYLISQNSEDLLTTKEACDFLKTNRTTLWSWVKDGKVKSYGISGNRVYYKKSELLESLKPLKK